MREMAGKIHHAGKRLHRRIEKFLDYAELISQHSAIGKPAVKVGMATLINPDEVVKRLTYLARDYSRNGDLETDLESSYVEIREDYFEI